MTTDRRHDSGSPGDAERDPRLDRLYRAAAQEGPPARLDDAIRAAARREVGARPRPLSARLRAWRVPVSIAAVFVLSVSLVTLVQEEGGDKLAQPPGRDDAPRVAEPRPAPPVAEPEAAKAPAFALQDARPPVARDSAPAAGAPASSRDDESARRREADRPRAAAPAPESQALPRPAPSPRPFQSAPGTLAQPERPAVPAAPSAGASMGTQSAGVRGPAAEDTAAAPGEPALAARSATRSRDAAAASEVAGGVAATRSAAPVAAMEAPQARVEGRLQKAERTSPDAAAVADLVKAFERQPPEKWLERIEGLKREGRQAEAEGMLAEFKRRFPTHPLPAGLR